MKTIPLDNGYAFCIQKVGKRLRLVVLNHGVENVCRLETPKNLRAFAQNHDVHLFKGRLQLHKQGPVVKILVKGKMVGEIGEKVISDWLISD